MHPRARRWFAQQTTAAADWPVERLRAAKELAVVSVVLPALNEERTIGTIVEGISKLAERTSLVDEIVVLDSGSTDATAKVARQAGATVFHRDDVLADHGSRPGKGEALWKALYVTHGDIIVFVDADLLDFGEHYITGLLGPLLTNPETSLVKAFYDRPLLDVSLTGGGRVTELMARPLLCTFFPELAGVVQPLAGEYAARRALLETLPFAPGYGVETGLLIDTLHQRGLDAIAQVDLGERTHGHQDTAALGRMAATILATVASRLIPEHPLWPALTQFERENGEPRAVDSVVSGEERPPMREIPEYRSRLTTPD